MHALILPYAFVSLSLVSTISSSVLNAIFAACINGTAAGIELLAFVALALNVLVMATLGFFLLVYVRKLHSTSTAWYAKRSWSSLALGVSSVVLAAVVTAITIAWARIKLGTLPQTMLQRSTTAIFISWCIVWGVSVALQFSTFSYLSIQTKRQQSSRSATEVDLDFGIAPEMQETVRPPTRDTYQSRDSRDHTFSSPPRTPTGSDAVSSLRSSLSVGVRPSNSRTKLVTRSRSFPRDSRNSSFDTAPRDFAPHDDAFDKWDTSGVSREIRETMLQASSPPTRGTLETIPGSRPESPADALDGPFLPCSPVNHVISSPPSSPPPSSFPPSSPPPSSTLPSSPPNFSRPTSRGNRPRAFSSEEHIHPLFRSSSPTPPPTATPGTTVTAAPFAGQTINGRTLNRMRSGSLPSSPSPLVHSEDIPEEPAQYGSPGPSMTEGEEQLPPIPGFILSAGARSSLVGYGRRKSSHRESSEEEDEAEISFF